MLLKFLLLIVIMAFNLTVKAQKPGDSTVAAESIVVGRDSTATILSWFKVIEKKGIVLSYNTSSIRLNEAVHLKKQTLSVTEFLSAVLHRYNFESNYVSQTKLLIRIKGEKTFAVRGHVADVQTGELLEGCAVLFRGDDRRHYSALTDASGSFCISVPGGRYEIDASYMGYNGYKGETIVNGQKNVHIRMHQAIFPLMEVQVKRSPLLDEVNYSGATGMMSVNGHDPFAQLSSRPGVVGSPVSGDLYVNGGQNDENLVLLDGISIYHSHHNNSLVAQFYSETVEKISFFDSFIPAQYEGRLSSVTDVRLRKGDAQHHHQTLALDLPSASLSFDGPIVRDKLTYMISGRHSWIDFMKNLLSAEPKASRTFNDLTAKLFYHISPKVSIEGLFYRSRDEYHDSIGNEVDQKILAWNNELYSISCHSQLPREIIHSSALSYTRYVNSIYAPIINIKAPVYINEGMKNLSFKSGFSKRLDEYVDMAWGLSVAAERYNLLASKDTVENNFEDVVQLSAYLNTRIKITEKLYGNVALNLVSYLPKDNESFFSIQPRFTLRYVPNSNNLFSLDFSRMEQFYHSICLGEIPLPTDLRMPSIGGFKPSSSVHCELGWRHINEHWRTSVSAYYKRRFEILGIRYNIVPEHEGWNKFIMSGDAASYGVKLHSLSQWDRWLLELSYTYSRSFEWFRDYDNNRKHTTLQDIPHLFRCATSYRVKRQSYFSLGGYIQSGTLENVLHDDFSSMQIIDGRRRRAFNYRLDFNFSSTVSSRNERLKFSYKAGLYNIVGNPKRNEVIDLYSIETNRHCLPYFTLNMRF